MAHGPYLLRGMAGARGSRTHRSDRRAEPTDLKSAEPTRTHPLPRPISVYALSQRGEFRASAN